VSQKIEEELMNGYSFMLNFNLPQRSDNPDLHLDALFEAGCDDASVGVGQFGMIGLDFTRRAISAEEALRSAIRNVQTAIPGANLVRVGPDLVGLTEMADIFGFTRQNMRKYATSKSCAHEAFPSPTIIGEPSLWHLAEIAVWLRSNTAIKPSLDLSEVSKAAARINFEVEGERLKRISELA
jgi:predicted DNA-binding transcriptional regulator AlpA